MTLGDLVMVNAFMIQLYIPLGFLGVIYREIKQSLTDLDKMFTVDGAGARGCGCARCLAAGDPPLTVRAAQAVSNGRLPACDFDHVSWPTHAARTILHDISFEIPAGQTVAVVGPSGARASRRWRGCCSASTTHSRARSRSPGRTSAR
jgi:ABC-type transport system involved in Fe-S cluster assembly fused permease/ATPase subunit